MSTHLVKHKQSLLDIALERYGTVTGIFNLIEDNALNGPTDNVYPQETLRINSKAYANTRIVQYLAPYTIATIQENTRASGIGWFVIESPHSNVFCLPLTL